MYYSGNKPSQTGKPYRHRSITDYPPDIALQFGFGPGTPITAAELKALMTDERLKALFDERRPIGLNDLLGLLILSEGLWDEALDAARDTNPQIAFRAAWALERAYDAAPAEIERRFVRFAHDFLTNKNGSVLRIYAKMLYDIILRSNIIIQGEMMEAIATRCFDLLIDPRIKVAVKIWCAESLYMLRDQIGWVDEHLEPVIRQLVESPECTAGLLNRYSKILLRLQRNSR